MIRVLCHSNDSIFITAKKWATVLSLAFLSAILITNIPLVKAMEATVISADESATTNVENLRKALSPQGWSVELDINGDILLTPNRVLPGKPEGNTQDSPQEKEEITDQKTPQPIDIESLRKLLAPHGWRVESDSEGGVLLFPKSTLPMINPPTGTDSANDPAPPLPDQSRKQDPSTVDNIPPDESPAPADFEAGFNSGDIDSLRNLLVPHGWRVEPDNEGGVFLYPRSRAKDAPAPTTSIETENKSAGDENKAKDKNQQSSNAGFGFTRDDIDDLRTLLVPHGWRVESDTQGDLLLYPKEKSSDFSTESSTPSTELAQPGAASTQPQSSTTSVVPFTDQGEQSYGQLRDILTSQGWGVEKDLDGSIILIPNAGTTQQLAPGSQGLVLAPISEGKITLPVNTRKKVRDLTLYWISTLDEQGLAPGMIRNINDIYVVSVVAKEAPHTLLHQLVFRKDGQMFLVY